jgi:hypothetical protein
MPPGPTQKDSIRLYQNSNPVGTSTGSDIQTLGTGTGTGSATEEEESWKRDLLDCRLDSASR